MNNTYNDMHNQAKREYRWLVTTYLDEELDMSLWPSPIGLIHAVIMLFATFILPIFCKKLFYDDYKGAKEKTPKITVKEKNHLFRQMVKHYFMEILGKEEYDKNLCLPKREEQMLPKKQFSIHILITKHAKDHYQVNYTKNDTISEAYLNENEKKKLIDNLSQIVIKE